MKHNCPKLFDMRILKRLRQGEVRQLVRVKPPFWITTEFAGFEHEQGIPGVPKLFTYVRYHPDLSREGLATLGLDNIRPEHV